MEQSADLHETVYLALPGAIHKKKFPAIQARKAGIY
jgi:hypothetical protein